MNEVHRLPERSESKENFVLFFTSAKASVGEDERSSSPTRER